MEISNAQKVKEIQEISYELLNDWEIGFMRNVERAVAAGQQLSDKRQAVLDRLYKMACASPY